MIQFFNKKMNKKRKGFTLIELIVVVAILGILAAIAIPRFSGVQANANVKAVLANLKMIDNAVSVYAANNNVDRSLVTKENLTDVNSTIIDLDEWPDGPGDNTVYTVNTSGYAEANVQASMPGVPIAVYTQADAASLGD